jgi:hypothetical protein
MWLEFLAQPSSRTGLVAAFGAEGCKTIHRTSATGHFETKSDAYRCASIGLILLQELTLTFWCSASKAGA